MINWSEITFYPCSSDTISYYHKSFWKLVFILDSITLFLQALCWSGSCGSEITDFSLARIKHPCSITAIAGFSLDWKYTLHCAWNLYIIQRLLVDQQEHLDSHHKFWSSCTATSHVHHTFIPSIHLKFLEIIIHVHNYLCHYSHLGFSSDLIIW